MTDEEKNITIRENYRTHTVTELMKMTGFSMKTVYVRKNRMGLFDRFCCDAPDKLIRGTRAEKATEEEINYIRENRNTLSIGDMAFNLVRSYNFVDKYVKIMGRIKLIKSTPKNKLTLKQEKELREINLAKLLESEPPIKFKHPIDACLWEISQSQNTTNIPHR